MRVTKVGFKRTLSSAVVATAALGVWTPAVGADEHIRGVITVRGDSTFAMAQETTSVPLLVVVTETTKIRSGTTKMSAPDLIPGLRVTVEGDYDSNSRLVAHRIEFTHEDHKIAAAVQAGLTPTNQQVMENASGIAKGAAAQEQQESMLESHKTALQRQAGQIEANELKAVATTGALTTRINDLDEFTVVDKLVVYFKNGQANVTPESASQLREFALKARGVDGYRLQVQGYASAVGSRQLNDALSLQRADAVTSVLLQKAGVPPSNIFVPAPMGISEQFADNKTVKGQSENRRVIVTMLQSKGLPHP